MFQKPVRRSMLGKRGLESKPRSIPNERMTIFTDDMPTTFSASRPSSRLGQRLLAENSSTVRKQNQKHSERNSSTKKNPVNFQSSQHNNVKKTLFGSAYKVDKEFNAEPQGNIKKCLFSSKSKENADPYFSSWNYKDSSADLTGITDLPMFSVTRPKSQPLDGTQKRAQDLKQSSDYIEMQLKKKSTPAKTPSRLHKELTSHDRTGLNPYRFTSGFPTLKPPVSPPQLYDMYMKNRTQNYTVEGQLLPYSVIKPDISISKSPKFVDTNSAYKKHNYRSWENVTTMTKSPKSYKNSQSSCETLIENQSITTNSTQKLNRTMSLESLYETNKPIENKGNACKHLNYTSSFENLSSVSIVQAIEKDNLGGNGIYKSNSWSIISSVNDKTDFQQTNKKDGNNSSTLKNVNISANSTIVDKYENPDDSFIYNETQSMIEYETETEEIITKKIKQLSLIPEEEETKNTLKLGQTICDEDEADLTLKPVCDSEVKPYCNLPYSITDKVNNISNPISSVDLLETSIKAMAKENTELLASFQREILNEYSVKLKETLHEVIKEQTIVRNKVIQEKFENVLQDKLQIFKNNLKNQSEEFTKLLDHLKSRFGSVSDKILHDMQSQSKIITEENKKLIEQFQKDVLQDFENKMLLIVNKSTYNQIDVISNAVKEDLESIFLVKWETIAQKIEIKKQECLTNLEFFRMDKENVLKKERECQEYKEKVECLHSVLNNFTDLNCDLINDYKNHLVFELQNKIEIVSKNMIQQQVDDILHVFQTILQDKLNLFVPKLNSLSEKWSSFKIDVMKNDNSFQNSVETAKSDICSGTTTVQKSDFKSPRKIESTRKMYSELRSQFKYCLKTPEPSRGRGKRYSHNTSSALTPRSMSNIINDQISQLLDS